jgi:heme-degrading monooxygenase HmoA
MDAEKYRAFVIKTGITDYQSVKGNLGAQVWQRQEGDITHIWTVSWWESFESIRNFAGEDPGKARYYEDDRDYLLEFEPSVMHCEVFDFRPVA